MAERANELGLLHSQLLRCMRMRLSACCCLYSFTRRGEGHVSGSKDIRRDGLAGRTS